MYSVMDSCIKLLAIDCWCQFVCHSCPCPTKESPKESFRNLDYEWKPHCFWNVRKVQALFELDGKSILKIPFNIHCDKWSDSIQIMRVRMECTINVKYHWFIFKSRSIVLCTPQCRLWVYVLIPNHRLSLLVSIFQFIDKPPTLQSIPSREWIRSRTGICVISN